jgi:hypothetical protein
MNIVKHVSQTFQNSPVLYKNQKRRCILQASTETPEPARNVPGKIAMNQATSHGATSLTTRHVHWLTGGDKAASFFRLGHMGQKHVHLGFQVKGLGSRTVCMSHMSQNPKTHGHLRVKRVNMRHQE